jgi:LPS export ABC transporter protein LptC
MLLLPAFLLLVGCEHRGGDAVTMSELRAEREPVEEVWNATIESFEGGRPRLHIQSARMFTFETEDSSYVLLEGDTVSGRVVVRLFDEAGQPSAVVQADRVIRLEDRGLFEARGDVSVVTVTHKRLESEELRWTEDERVIRSSGFVRIETPTERLSGYGLEATEDLDSYRLERVTGTATLTDPE